ncbi:MAG: hypothetical protein ABI321_23260 [Polyangia bacterium]
MNSLCYALLVAPALLTACGGSSTSDDMAHVVVTGDMTTTSDMLVTATGDMAHTASPDMLAPAAPPQVIEGCNAVDYIDMTGATGVIAVTPWNPTLGKKCLRVKSGAQVSWAASSTHPLEATTGSTPTPIPASPGVQTATTLTFSTAGAVYGWQCAVHTSLMHGAIWVE